MPAIGTVDTADIRKIDPRKPIIYNNIEDDGVGESSVRVFNRDFAVDYILRGILLSGGGGRA